MLAQWPQLRLRLFVDDALVDLIDARIDIAVRIGRLADSNWIARPLCVLNVIACAATAYVERHGAPDSPEDLAGHDWLALARETAEAPSSSTHVTPPAAADAGSASHKQGEQQGEGRPTVALDLYGADGAHRRVQVGVRIASNSQLALQQICEEGLGLARLATTDVRAAMSRGALVRVLPRWHFTPMPVAAVTPRRDAEPAKVRVAVKALKRYFDGFAGVDAPRGPSLAVPVAGSNALVG